MPYTEETYPFLIMDIMSYIEEVKKTEKETSLIEIIADFARKEQIELQVIGEAIAGDPYFKSFIKKDCELHKIFKSKKMDSW